MKSWIKNFEYSEETRLLYYQAIVGDDDFRICVPEGETRQQIINNAHSSALGARSGHFRT